MTARVRGTRGWRRLTSNQRLGHPTLSRLLRDEGRCVEGRMGGGHTEMSSPPLGATIAQPLPHTNAAFSYSNYQGVNSEILTETEVFV